MTPPEQSNIGATCPTCGKKVALTKAGKLRFHKRPPRRGIDHLAWLNEINVRCSGSGKAGKRS